MDRVRQSWFGVWITCLGIACAAPGHATVVLQYHHISDTTPASTSTSPERFEMHLDALAAQNFTIVPLQQMVDLLRSGRPLPDRTAAITFDDGYASIYSTAFPLLKQRAWPFTVFINTEPHDRAKSGFLSWDQLREMSRGGATVANHTVSHPYLLEREEGQDESAWRAWVTKEILDAQRRIEQEIGSAPNLFAYPYGEYNEAVLAIVDSLGFAGFGQHSGPLARHSDLRALPRFPFGGPYGDPEDFTTKVNSLPMPLTQGPDAIRWEAADGRRLTDIVLQGDAARPKLILQFERGFGVPSVNCFVSGQGRLLITRSENRMSAQSQQPLPPGRSRYNCTAPSSEPSRYYWFSQPWIVRHPGEPALRSP